MIKCYRKRPVEVRALVFDGTNQNEVKQFCGNWCIVDNITNELRLKTLEDRKDTSHYVSVGDVIIEGAHGEYYACKPDIFEKTYEEI